MARLLDGGKVEHKPLKLLAAGSKGAPLMTRIWLASSISVLAAIVLGIGLAYPLVRESAETQAREVLSEQADVVVELIFQNSMMGDGHAHGRGDLRRDLGPDVVVIPVIEGEAVPEPLSDIDVRVLLSGEKISGIIETDEGRFFVEGRPISTTQAIVLVQRDNAADAPASSLMSKMITALAFGFVLAGIIAWLVARRIAKPLSKAAEAAQRIATGDREVDVEVTGAKEVAEIAASLNYLAANLANSEDRQREFFMSISHELRTPMTSIKGYAEALSDGVIEAEGSAAAGALIAGETERLDRLISDLLDLARTGAVDFKYNPVETDICSVARDAAEAWSLRCNKSQLSFESNISSDALLGKVDPTRLRQIIDNLMENAVRILPADGKIRMSVQAHANNVEIIIEDDGPGLTDEDIAVAFEPAALHSRYAGVREVGTGLGLALVGRLTGKMGGKAIASHSDLGGAKFTVIFPKV
ncbi:MAG: hypothetical protein RLZZ330_847 [Actinomycetota bacterium]|jgi:two-component system sensor histidine kinase BaeS